MKRRPVRARPRPPVRRNPEESKVREKLREVLQRNLELYEQGVSNFDALEDDRQFAKRWLKHFNYNFEDAKPQGETDDVISDRDKEMLQELGLQTKEDCLQVLARMKLSDLQELCADLWSEEVFPEILEAETKPAIAEARRIWTRYRGR